MAAPDPFRRRLRVHRLVWVGIAVVVLGTGPLLAIITAATLGWTDDPNPNPVGPGILAMCTFVPGLALGVTGAVLTVVEYVRDRPRTGD